MARTGRSGRGGATPLTPEQDVQRRIDNYITRLGAAQQPVPEPHRNLNRLLAVLNTIDKPRNALVNAIDDTARGENGFMQGLKEGWTRKEETTGSDLLNTFGVQNKWARGIGGFGLDVLLDPTNYVAPGVGSLAKGFLTGAGRTVSKESAEAALRAGVKTGMSRATTALGSHMDEVMKPFMKARNFAGATDDVADMLYKALPDVFDPHIPKVLQGEMADKVLRGNAIRALDFGKVSRQYLDHVKGTHATDFANILDDITKQYSKEGGKGMRVFGKELISGAKMQDAGAALSKRTIEPLSQGISTLTKGKFDPVGQLRRTAGQGFKVGSELMDVQDPAMRGMVRQWTKEMKAQEHVANTELMERAKNMFLGVPEDKLQTVRKALESHNPDAGAALEESLRGIYTALKGEWAKYGVEENIFEKIIKDYVPHVISDENMARKSFWKGGIRKNLGVTNINALGRKYAKDIDTINAVMKAETNIDNFFETNLAKIFVDRGIKHNRFIASRDFIDKILYGLGRNTRHLTEEEVQKGYVLVVPKTAVDVYGLNMGADTTIKKAMAVADKDVARIQSLLDQVRKRKISELGGRGFAAQIPRVKIKRGATSAILRAKELGDNVPLTDTDSLRIAEEVVNSAMERMDTGVRKKAEKMVVGTINTLPINKNNKSLLMRLIQANGRAVEEFTEDEVKALGVLVKDLDVVAVPRGVVDYVNNANLKQMDEGINLIGRAIDTFYKYFKPAATQMNPAYHGRNIVGSEMQNFLDNGFASFNPVIRNHANRIIGFNDFKPDIEGAAKLGGKTYTYKELRDSMRRYNVLATFMDTDYTRLDKLVKEKLTHELQPNKIKKAGQTLKNAPKWVGGKVEALNRANAFLSGLDRGLDIEAAAKNALRYHFDYSELSKMEKAVMKRAFPFYSWMRNNVPLQLEEILNNPGRYNTMANAQRNAADVTGTDLSNAPDWLAEQIPLPFGEKDEETGRQRMLSVSPPVSDINMSATDLFTSMNPLLKLPIELLANRNFLTGAPINRTGVYPETESYWGIPMDKRVAYAAKGVLGFPGRFGNDILSPPPDEELMENRITHNNPWWTFGATKDYSEDAARLDRKREYEQQLGNLLQKLEDEGIDIKTLEELQRRMGGRRGR